MFPTPPAALHSVPTGDTVARAEPPSAVSTVAIVPGPNALLCDVLAKLFQMADPRRCQVIRGDVQHVRWMLGANPRSVCILDNPDPELIKTVSAMGAGPTTMLLVPSDLPPLRLRELAKLRPAAIVSYDTDVSQFRAALSEVESGRPYVCDVFRNKFRVTNNDRLEFCGGSILDGLTNRQMQVARSLATGSTIAAVAKNLGLAEKTVESHWYRIKGRLGISGRVNLTRLLTREGAIVPLPTRS